jgi:hypothetical protein
LSFRNEEDSLKSWHLNDRNKSLRQRRSLQDEQSSESDSRNSIAIPSSSAFIDVSDDGSDILSIDDNDDYSNGNDKVIKLVRSKRNDGDDNKLAEMAIYSLDDDLKSNNINNNDPSRSRRDASVNCGGNVNTKSRQLNVGCSEEYKMEVSPQCSDDANEGRRTLFFFSIID